MRVLDDARYVNLATFRKSGARVDTPVWAAPHGGRLYVFVAGDSGKVKRLRNSSRAQVAPCDARGRLIGEWASARARIVNDVVTVDRAYAALRAKYGWQMRLTDLLSRLSGRHGRRAILEIEVLDGEESTSATIEGSP
jgi:PPOX class probable F420-dependent enzyme